MLKAKLLTRVTKNFVVSLFFETIQGERTEDGCPMHLCN